MINIPTLRLRRLRMNPTLRSLVRETTVTARDLICPIFVKGEEGPKQPIRSMPGCFQIPISGLEEEIEELLRLNISSILLFGIPSHKDLYGSESFSDQGIIQKAIRKIKSLTNELLVITDLCFCEYTEHGHCGVIENGMLNNDVTLQLLAKQAISHAEAGADMVAPSGMLDGMVGAIRKALDGASFSHIPILSYSVKYASCMYGPFRDAAEGAPSFGDRRSHQMDPSNGKEALREVEMDVREGADMLIIGR